MFSVCACFVLRAPGAHTLSLVSKTAFNPLHILGFWLREPGCNVSFIDYGPGARFLRSLLLTVRDRFGSGSQISKKFVITGPGPFWLREPVL